MGSHFDRIGVCTGLHGGGRTKEEISQPIILQRRAALRIPPNPVVKAAHSITYDYASSGRYAKGTEHAVGGTHTVLATDEEFAAWTR